MSEGVTESTTETSSLSPPSSSSSSTCVPAEGEVEEAIRLGQTELAMHFDFPLDDWQLQAGGFILMGYNVIVCAPTGSGKTVVGEMALHRAYDRNMDGIYTTPLKALSNQKFGELRQVFGPTNVGLSTGDISINRHGARLTVMTTEVYRNIAWRSSAPESSSSSTTTTATGTTESSLPFGYNNIDISTQERPSNSNDLRRNAVVVLDELHYMGLPGRGGVWEECVITSPAHTQIVGLSATLPNAFQLTEWMESVTGRPTRLVEAKGARPVPLKYLFATREGLFPLFRNPDAGPGSPLGLLGYRGDGIPPSGSTPPSKSKNGGIGFGKNDARDDSYGDEKLPRGLQVNPALSGLAQRRMQKVNRMVERQKEQLMSRSYGGRSVDDDWDLYNEGGRGRGRKANSPVRQLTNREERKERERIMRKEMRKAVPSLPILLMRLKEKNLLPAIFFIFSRAGCDQAAATISNSFKGPRDPTVDVEFDDDYETNSYREFQSKKKQKVADKTRKKDGGRSQRRRLVGDNSLVEDREGRTFRLSSNANEDIFNAVMNSNQERLDEDSFLKGSPLAKENWKFYTSAGLLSYEEVREVAGRIVRFNEENEEIEFTDDAIEQLLFGVGRHHAGMLPAHKMFSENLFRMNLMKVVFATETLAAGINMPARTTVVCALAKRAGGGSMELLETSNLLQMAGRAGRRGMDTAGTCVLVATPFESEDVAAKILTDPLLPISSQFRPSYALAMNLIARGEGRLDVAKQLVSKSFANWGRQQLEISLESGSDGDGIGEVLTNVAEEKFLTTLAAIFEKKVEQRTAQYSNTFLSYLLEILKDRELLKKSSKSYEASILASQLEETTLAFLEIEMKNLVSAEEVSDESGGAILKGLQEEDRNDLIEQVERQRLRSQVAEKQVRKHPFTSIAGIANEILDSDSLEGTTLLSALNIIPGMGDQSSLDVEDIAKFAKSAIVVKRKLKKLSKLNPDVDPEALLLQTVKVTEEVTDSAWNDMLSITKVLLAYGCLVRQQSNVSGDVPDAGFENETFEVTPAGKDVGMLSFENSLWCFLAMGGTWDVLGVSSQYDEMKQAMKVFVDDDDSDFFADDADLSFSDDSITSTLNTNVQTSSSSSKARQEAGSLVSLLRDLTPGEIAGYVSCLVAGDTARGGTISAIEVFKRLGPRQQRSIQVLLDVTERFMDVQRQYSVDETTCRCQFDLSHAEVITAWADGCSWSEALEISGVAPGDLTRIIGRALDAVRQIGGLKYNPLRKRDLDDDRMIDPFSRGIHPDIRRLCREAAKMMNRYPVKDPLPFEVDDDEVVDDFDSDDEGDYGDDDDDDDDGDDTSDFEAVTE